MFDVFLSHNSLDKPAVELLAQRLKSEGKLNPFLDQWSLVPGSTWLSDLEGALAESQSVAVFIGPHGLSPWHAEELRVALTTAVRTRDEYRVIPVLLPGARSEEVKGFLAQRTWVDFRKGLDDVVALKRLVAGIKGQAPESDTYQLPDEPAPYRGLLPFGKEQSRFFFGREGEIQEVLDKLAGFTSVAVVGASGVGKSSLVLGGVVPRLENPHSGFGPNLRVRAMTPGNRPLRALADQIATLVPPESRLATVEALVPRLASNPEEFRTAVTTLTADRPGPFVLVVDQLEELITYGSPEGLSPEALAFLRTMRDVTERGQGSFYILATLRADFFARFLEVPTLRELLRDRQVLLGGMGDDALRYAIVRPAQEVGAFLERGLVSTILKDVSREPGALPLLEHALYELWRARNGAWLTLAAYEESGGVSGALRRRAQSTYEALSPEEQEIARLLFLRLTALGEGTQDTRRRIARSELVFPGTTPEQVEHVLQVLSAPAARLLVTGEDFVEVAHEVLIQEWGTLRAWVNTNRRQLYIQRRLTEAANGWVEHQRDSSYLYTGSRLMEAEECFTQELGAPRPGRLNQRELDFMAASLARRDELRLEEQRRQQEELAHAQQLATAEAARARAARRAARRLRVLAVVLILAAAGVFGLWVVASRERKEAFSRELTAHALLNIEKDPQLSLLLTQEAGRIAVTDQVSEALYAWHRAPGWMILRETGSAVNEVGFSPDGTRAVTANEDGTALLWELRTGNSRVLAGNEGAIWSARFSPDGHRVVTASAEGMIRLWDVASGKSIALLPGNGEAMLSAEFSPDGLQVATAGNEGTVLLWDVASGRSRVLSRHEGSVLAVRFSPDGRRLVTAGFQGTVHLWDVSSGRLRILSGHEGAVRSAEFSKDGTRLVTAGLDGTVRLWNTDTGTQAALFSGHEGAVWSVRFSPESTRLVSASEDGTARVWDVTGGKPPLVLLGHAGVVWSARFSPDGSRVVTVSDDETVRLWDVSTGDPLSVLTGHTAPVLSVEYSQDGTRLLTASLDGTARLWDVAFSKLSTILSGHVAPVLSGQFSPEGKRVVSASLDGTARLWDVATGESRVLSGHDGDVRSAEFSPDGLQVVTASSDETVRLWSATTGESRVLAGHEGGVRSARFSPDGTRIVSASDDGTARLWDVATGESRVLSGHEGAVLYAEFSPDGTRVVTAGMDETVRLWDVASGQSLSVLDEHDKRVWSARFSPDGKKVITASNDGTARLWDVVSGESRILATHDKPVLSACFSPDGKKVVTASDDGTARLWDVASGKALLVNSGVTGPMRAAEFSPQGRWIVTASDDGNVRLWELNTDHSHVLSGHQGPVRFAGFSPDGLRVISVSDDGMARLWPHLLWAPTRNELSSLVAGRSLSTHERQRYLQGRKVLPRRPSRPVPER
ncbi:High-affnity carbon uptake protein Hat/HatR [Archangium gephyra]|uniref:High-affnity carbon uptake protein Hat/HatR n=1 Tax=Archangium gephyra TaxID=48 RepID=A0AAC8TDI0_9BACT|nr:TIR domain-containing protein [Archangium gephyra]AKJ01798.1 High-affnity carbon uptake protein Hat/HatR [Archangium gephyra]